MDENKLTTTANTLKGCVLIFLVIVAVVFSYAAFKMWAVGISVQPSGETVYTAPHSNAKGILLPGLLVAITAVATVWWIVSSPNKNDTIDGRVNNIVLGFDRETQSLLVAARNIRAIEGVNTHVPKNLPANIWSVGDGLYVVDPYHRFDSPGGYDDARSCIARGDVVYEELPGGPREIVPRGAGVNWSGFLADVMAGFDDYEYVRSKGDRPDISAQGVKVWRG